MGRVTRPSAQRGRLLWAAAAVGVALVVALVMVVADLADTAEIVATVLLAFVAVAALWIGRAAGLAMAVAAAAVYAGLRVGDVDDVGAAGVGVLVMARAAVFVAVGWFTPVVAPLLPGMERSGRPRHGVSGTQDDRGPAPAATAPSPSPAAALAELGALGDDRGARFAGDEPSPVLGFAGTTEPAPPDAWGLSGTGGWDDAVEDDGVWDDDGLGVPPTSRWEEPLTPPTETWDGAPPPIGEPRGHGADDGYGPVAGGDGAGYQPAPVPPVAWDHPTDPGVASGNGGHGADRYDDGDHRVYDDQPAYEGGVAGDVVGGPPGPSPAWGPSDTGPASWDQVGGPVSPQMPTGWLDDVVEPAGDQTIPVGYTGELFLPPDLASAPGPDDAVEPRHAGNGWTGPGDRAAPPSYPTRDTAARAVAGGMPPGRDRAGRRPSRPSAPPAPAAEPVVSTVDVAGSGQTSTQDPETRLWNARFFRERLATEVEASRQAQESFSVVLVKVPDEPFRALPYRRQVALLRELGHQFVASRVVDHLVHLPDGEQHWFAVILAGTDRTGAQDFEKRLRSAIGGYLRHRGLQVHDIESASMTSPDDDQVMAEVWASLLGSSSPYASGGY